MVARKAGPTTAVTLRTADGSRIDITNGEALETAALAWRYIARHRVRFEGSRVANDSLPDRAIETFHRLGLDDDALAVLTMSRLVEVSIPYSQAAEHAYARIMPWEGLIGAAAGTADSPLVVRHLALPRRKRMAAARRRGSKAAVILGAVDALSDAYTFETERIYATQGLGAGAKVLEDPSGARLKKSLTALSPDVIHVGGVDVHQGSELLADRVDLGTVDTSVDGMVLTDDAGRIESVHGGDLARILTSGSPKPRLVVLNLYYSAGEIAPLIVAAGAEVAIGFQDRFDDLAAESFFGELYRAWRASSGDLLASLHLARATLASLSPWSSAGLVVWSARPVLDRSPKKIAKDAERIKSVLEKDQPRPDLTLSLAAAAAALNVQIVPIERLNYALMHNGRPMFETFEIRNVGPLPSHRVRVEVELFAGTERLPYCSALDVGSLPVSVDGKVFIPLTSTLIRSLRESVRASLRVRISVGSGDIYENSYRVTLLSTDEWVDSDEDRQWLPSFVLPTDPAIETVIAAARPVLAFLADTASAGFDGYQSVDPEAEDPSEGVDWQVEAIWSSLVARPLGYINPPPTYTLESQRLRFPSRILRSGDGTCIDLALLFAACLEHVNIFPVMFLLSGHAFPGYWRSETAWQEFVGMHAVEKMNVSELHALTKESGTGAQEYPWVFPASFHAELMKEIEKKTLVPLETVWITTRSKFADAQDTGWENLLNPDEFEGMIDITLARENDVTPLPGREGDA